MWLLLVNIAAHWLTSIQLIRLPSTNMAYDTLTHLLQRGRYLATQCHGHVTQTRHYECYGSLLYNRFEPSTFSLHLLWCSLATVPAL